MNDNDFNERAALARAIAPLPTLTKTGQDMLRIAAFAGFDVKVILLIAYSRSTGERVSGALIERIMGEYAEVEKAEAQKAEAEAAATA